LKLDDIEKGPGIWAMNFNTITSELFINAFNTWWGIYMEQRDRKVPKYSRMVGCYKD